MTAYYNEFDQQTAAWLRELIRRGLIADGDVDERSIVDVRPDDLRGYTQCHFFAGIGGWSYALRLAGWPDDKPVWTGSPPCQPFSAAGLGRGRDDARHLGPHFVDLVRACRPDMLFGEQVASSAVFGRVAKVLKRAVAATIGFPEWAWWDDLSVRLEHAQYAVGAGDIPAASVGAPHIRQRCFFGAVGMADAECWTAERHGYQMDAAPGGMQGSTREQWVRPDARNDGQPFGLADADNAGSQGRPGMPERASERAAGAGGMAERMADAEHAERRSVGQHGEDGRHGPHSGREEAHGFAGTCGKVCGRPAASDLGWPSADWLYCRDGKWRPVEPLTFPLADGVPGRVGLLRGYGNAIVPQAAAQFIAAFSAAAQHMRTA